jgi:hypothetical protein
MIDIKDLNPLDPIVFKQEIAEDFKAALKQFYEMAKDPGEEKDEPQKDP